MYFCCTKITYFAVSPKKTNLTLSEQAKNINEHLMQHQVTFIRRSNFKPDLFQNSDTFTRYNDKKFHHSQ